MAQKIPVYRHGKIVAYTLVDDDIAELYQHRTFRLANNGYVVMGSGSQFSLHRAVTQAPTGLEVDHRNRNRLDNTRANLRLVTRQQNATNRGAYHNRKYKGVYPHKGRFLASITNRKIRTGTVHLGIFKTETEAACAYNQAATRLGIEVLNGLSCPDQNLLPSTALDALPPVP